MRTRLGFAITNNYSCFLRFVGSNSSYVKLYYSSLPYRDKIDEDEIPKIADAIKVLDLIEQFESLLDNEEKASIAYTQYHNPDDKKPEFLEMHLSSAFIKWQGIFFKDNSLYYEELNPKYIGEIMKYMRKRIKMPATELAQKLGVDRITVHLIEGGKRLPSLGYIYKFSRIFKISIDRIVDLSLQNSL